MSSNVPKNTKKKEEIPNGDGDLVKFNVEREKEKPLEQVVAGAVVETTSKDDTGENLHQISDAIPDSDFELLFGSVQASQREAENNVKERRMKLSRLVSLKRKRKNLFESDRAKRREIEEKKKEHGTIKNKLSKVYNDIQNLEKGKSEKSRYDAIEFTFGDIKTKSAVPDWREFISKRAILATTNEQADEINNLCLEQMPGNEIVIPSADSTANPDDATHYPLM